MCVLLNLCLDDLRGWSGEDKSKRSSSSKRAVSKRSVKRMSCSVGIYSTVNNIMLWSPLVIVSFKNVVPSAVYCFSAVR